MLLLFWQVRESSAIAIVKTIINTSSVTFGRFIFNIVNADCFTLSCLLELIFRHILYDLKMLLKSL